MAKHQNSYGDGVGRSGESENYLDKVQDAAQAGDQEAQEAMAVPVTTGETAGNQQVEVDESSLDDEPTALEAQVETRPVKVVYMPRKDFTARVNQTEYEFNKGVPTKVSRDVANMLLEDEERGYVKE